MHGRGSGKRKAAQLELSKEAKLEIRKINLSLEKLLKHNPAPDADKHIAQIKKDCETAENPKETASTTTRTSVSSSHSSTFFVSQPYEPPYNLKETTSFPTSFTDETESVVDLSFLPPAESLDFTVLQRSMDEPLKKEEASINFNKPK